MEISFLKKQPIYKEKEMTEKITVSELKNMVSKSISEKGLEGFLDVDKIVSKVRERVNLENAKKSIPQEISEVSNPALPTEMDKFPNEMEKDAEEIANMQTPQVNTPTPVDMGTTGNISAYTPELPSFMDKIGPAKVIIFSQNELSESGENLTNKPLRTFENPDVKKSMNDFWVGEGKKTAEVYMAKLEKVGEINFDFANGTSVFTEKRFEPDFEAQAKYKENPYMGNVPGSSSLTLSSSDSARVDGIANPITLTAVDLEKAVSDIVMNVMKNYFLTNTERAVTESPKLSVAPDVNNPIIPANEPKEKGFGVSTSQVVKPMEEGFKLTMMQVVEERNGFQKTDTPAVLRESIEKGDNKYLTNENESVQEWAFEGKMYYTPKNRISIKKCYTITGESAQNTKKSLL